MFYLNADDRPGTIFVTSDAGCTVSHQFTSAAFVLTVPGAVPDSGNWSALLIRRCKLPGAAAHDVQVSKVRAFLQRVRQVALVLKADKGVTWKSDFQFRSFGTDLRALGAEAKKWSPNFPSSGQVDARLLLTSDTAR